MKRRFFTGLVFVLIILGSVFSGFAYFSLLFGCIAGLCLWEFAQLVLHDTPVTSKLISVIIGLFPLIFMLMFLSDQVSSKYFLLFPVLFFTVFLVELWNGSGKSIENMGYHALATVYIGIPFAIFIWMSIHQSVYLPGRIAGLLFLTWANDTGAYISGNLWGRHPLMKRISPKKTWEGFAGGVVMALLFGFALSYMPLSGLKSADWWYLAIIISIFGPVGDLIESMLKRERQAKDSGNLLPGHGGFLDRFDALIFHIPFCALYLFWSASE
jgi:phosphatidate cytidylyltransferase